MIIRIYDYNGKGKLVKIPDDCEYIEFDILNGDMAFKKGCFNISKSHLFS